MNEESIDYTPILTQIHDTQKDVLLEMEILKQLQINQELLFNRFEFFILLNILFGTIIAFGVLRRARHG